MPITISPKNRFTLACAFYLLVALYTVSFLVRAIPGMQPASLWLDDQWVACLISSPAAAALNAGAPTPLGFLFAEKGIYDLLGPADWALQLLPLIFAILCIPTTAFLGNKIFESRYTALMMTMLASASSLLLTYSVRVKQYSGEALASSLFILLFAYHIKKPSVKLFTLLCISIFPFLSFSYAGIIIYCTCLHFSIFSWKKREFIKYLLILLVTDTAIFLYYLATMAEKRTTAMLGYWHDFFPSRFSIADLFHFILDKGQVTLAGVFIQEAGVGQQFIALLVLCGMGVLLLKKQTRMFGCIAWSVFLGCIVLSLLHIYPLGGGRTDLFLFPIIILSLGALLHAGVIACKKTWCHVLLTGLLGVALFAASGNIYASYPDVDDAQLVRELVRVAEPDDGVLVYPHANWAVGYYAPWNAVIQRTEYYAHGFAMLPQRNDTMVFPGGAAEIPYTAIPDTLLPSLGYYLSHPHKRIFLIVLYGRQDIIDLLTKILQTSGYRLSRQKLGKNGSLHLFERAEKAK